MNFLGDYICPFCMVKIFSTHYGKDHTYSYNFEYLTYKDVYFDLFFDTKEIEISYKKNYIAKLNFDDFKSIDDVIRYADCIIDNLIFI